MVLVATLHVFPVKSLRGVGLDQARVEPWGLAGDRRWMVVDGKGRFLSQREHPRLATIATSEHLGGLTFSFAGHADVTVPRPGEEAPRIEVSVWRDRVMARDAGQAAADVFEAVLGQAARLVYMDDPAGARPVDPAYGEANDTVSFADGFPLLLASTSSLADVNGRLNRPVPMGRFRPNLVIDGAACWAEDGWSRIRVGSVPFDVVKPCTRCAVPTVDQITGAKSADNEPIRTMQSFRRDARGRILFGQNLIPRGTGVIQVGDRVEIVA